MSSCPFPCPASNPIWTMCLFMCRCFMVGSLLWLSHTCWNEGTYQFCILEGGRGKYKIYNARSDRGCFGIDCSFLPSARNKKQNWNWPAMSSKWRGMVIFTESEFTLGSSATDCGKFSQAQWNTSAAWGGRVSSLGTAVCKDAFFGRESP